MGSDLGDFRNDLGCAVRRFTTGKKDYANAKRCYLHPASQGPFWFIYRLIKTKGPTNWYGS